MQSDSSLLCFHQSELPPSCRSKIELQERREIRLLHSHHHRQVDVYLGLCDNQPESLYRTRREGCEAQLFSGKIVARRHLSADVELERFRKDQLVNAA